MRGWRTNFALSLSLTRPASSSPSASVPRASGLFDLGGVDQSFRQSIHDMLSVSPSLSLLLSPRRFAIWPLSGVLRGGRRQRVRQWKDFYACLAHATFLEILSIRCLPSKRERPTCCPPAPPRTFPTPSLSSPSPECRKSSLSPSRPFDPLY